MPLSSITPARPLAPTPVPPVARVEPDAWQSFIDRVFEADRLDYVPPRAWAVTVASRMFSLGYGDDAAREVLAFVAMVGTVTGCGRVHDRHREELDRLLPFSAAWVRIARGVQIEAE